MFRDWKTWLLLSLTLGLAPFVPEPHIVGKLRWIAGGAVGMKAMDWLDFIWHGLPFVGLAWSVFIAVKGRSKVEKNAATQK